MDLPTDRRRLVTAAATDWTVGFLTGNGEYVAILCGALDRSHPET